MIDTSSFVVVGVWYLSVYYRLETNRQYCYNLNSTNEFRKLQWDENRRLRFITQQFSN